MRAVSELRHHFSPFLCFPFDFIFPLHSRARMIPSDFPIPTVHRPRRSIRRFLIPYHEANTQPLDVLLTLATNFFSLDPETQLFFLSVLHTRAGSKGVLQAFGYFIVHDEQETRLSWCTFFFLSSPGSVEGPKVLLI